MGNVLLLHHNTVEFRPCSVLLAKATLNANMLSASFSHPSCSRAEALRYTHFNKTAGRTNPDSLWNEIVRRTNQSTGWSKRIYQ